jgi:hypothetical protein
MSTPVVTSNELVDAIGSKVMVPTVVLPICQRGLEDLIDNGYVNAPVR